LADAPGGAVVIRSLGELADPATGLSVLYAAVAAALVWGFVVGAIAAIFSSAARGGE